MSLLPALTSWLRVCTCADRAAVLVSMDFSAAVDPVLRLLGKLPERSHGSSRWLCHDPHRSAYLPALPGPGVCSESHGPGWP